MGGGGETGGGGGTHVVQVDIDAAEVGQHKVANGVGPLDGLGVIVKRVQKPGVFGGDQLA